MTPLKETGKPMRALHALVGTNPSEPLTEYGVWSATGRNGGRWWAALRTLVERGLAKRTGRRGGYEWYITDAGCEVIDAELAEVRAKRVLR